MSARSIAIAPVFRLDEHGSIIGPGNMLIATKDEQVHPAALVLDIDALNRLMSLAIEFMIAEGIVERGHERRHLEAIRSWIEEP